MSRSQTPTKHSAFSKVEPEPMLSDPFKGSRSDAERFRRLASELATYAAIALGPWACGGAPFTTGDVGQPPGYEATTAAALPDAAPLQGQDAAASPDSRVADPQDAAAQEASQVTQEAAPPAPDAATVPDAEAPEAAQEGSTDPACLNYCRTAGVQCGQVHPAGCPVVDCGGCVNDGLDVPMTCGGSGAPGMCGNACNPGTTWPQQCAAATGRSSGHTYGEECTVPGFNAGCTQTTLSVSGPQPDPNAHFGRVWCCH